MFKETDSGTYIRYVILGNTTVDTARGNLVFYEWPAVGYQEIGYQPESN